VKEIIFYLAKNEPLKMVSLSKDLSMYIDVFIGNSTFNSRYDRLDETSTFNTLKLLYKTTVHQHIH